MGQKQSKGVDMIRIAVCDDDERTREETLALLRDYRNVSLEAEGYSGGEALLEAGKTYDILLLDIDMDGMDGIETARRIREADREVKLIYVTNYSDYMMFAFAVHAFAYLLKPLGKKELYAQLDEVLRYSSPRPESDLEFVTREGVLRMQPSRILYFEYLDRWVLLHTTDGVWHLKRQIAEVAREMAPFGFAVPHKSVVVNLYAVRQIKGYEVSLTDGQHIPLSQKKSAAFRRAMNEYLAGEGGRAVWHF